MTAFLITSSNVRVPDLQHAFTVRRSSLAPTLGDTVKEAMSSAPKMVYLAVASTPDRVSCSLYCSSRHISLQRLQYTITKARVVAAAPVGISTIVSPEIFQFGCSTDVANCVSSVRWRSEIPACRRCKEQTRHGISGKLGQLLVKLAIAG